MLDQQINQDFLAAYKNKDQAAVSTLRMLKAALVNKKIEKLILNADLRCEMGEKSYQKTLEKYTTKNAKNEEYYAYLRSKL